MFHLHLVILHHLEWVYQKGPKSDVNKYIYIAKCSMEKKTYR